MFQSNTASAIHRTARLGREICKRSARASKANKAILDKIKCIGCDEEKPLRVNDEVAPTRVVHRAPDEARSDEALWVSRGEAVGRSNLKE